MVSKILTSPVFRFAGEAFAWTLPILLVFAGHKAAASKADLPDVGQGFHIAFMTERTLRAQRLWHYTNERTWLFGLYATVLVVLFGTLTAFRVPPLYRWLCWTLVALPGCWYSRETIYLGGKLLSIE
jgi:hypothetical protein